MLFKAAKLVIALAVLVGAGYLVISPSVAPDRATPKGEKGKPFLSPGNGGANGLADSADEVGFHVKWQAQPAKQKIPSLSVTLVIAPGWHVNAHPASLEFLVPTTASGTVNGQVVKLDTRYPAGVDSGIRLNGKAIQVFDSGVTIAMKPIEAAWALIREAGQLTVRLRVQSCSDKGVCLAPSTLSKVIALPKKLQGF